LFDPGRAQVRAEAKPVLLGLASAIAGRFPERSVRIEGHTDSTQPRRVVEEFPTNWELSAARSLAVLRFLIDDAKLPKERVIAAAFGEHRPVKDNASAEGREENRRVDIIIMPTVGVDRVETAGLLP
jgi:chemotaxis protein MotB